MAGLSLHVTRSGTSGLARIDGRNSGRVFQSCVTKQAPPRQCARARWPVHALNTARDLVTGDALILTSFCIYKQLAAIVLSPSFPGWLSPLTFSPTRFTELVGFTITVAGTWVACSMLNGDYSNPAESTQQSACPQVSVDLACTDPHQWNVAWFGMW